MMDAYFSREAFKSVLDFIQCGSCRSVKVRSVIKTSVNLNVIFHIRRVMILEYRIFSENNIQRIDHNWNEYTSKLLPLIKRYNFIYSAKGLPNSLGRITFWVVFQIRYRKNLTKPKYIKGKLSIKNISENVERFSGVTKLHEILSD